MLVLLEKLTPKERAIFILRETFAYDYKELAEIFDKTEDSCRQLFKRAKDSLGSDTKRFEVDLKVHEKILANFIEATKSGNIDRLIKMLKEDIVLFADGGGNSIPVNGQRLTAALKPIYGKDAVIRFLLSIIAKVQEHIPGFHTEIILTNGMPSSISYSGNIPISLTSFEYDDGKIRNIYVQSNPEKLRQFIKAL
jgi:RNA polymerase sigma-70 factor (ECF subfamily)